MMLICHVFWQNSIDIHAFSNLSELHDIKEKGTMQHDSMGRDRKDQHPRTQERVPHIAKKGIRILYPDIGHRAHEQPPQWL